MQDGNVTLVIFDYDGVLSREFPIVSKSTAANRAKVYIAE